MPLSQGEDVFIKKLIPHVFMSKDEFPPSLTSEMVLHQTFEFMEEWKSRLYDMLSFNTAQVRQGQGLRTPTSLMGLSSSSLHLYLPCLLFQTLPGGTICILNQNCTKSCKIALVIRSLCHLLYLELQQQKRSRSSKRRWMKRR